MPNLRELEAAIPVAPLKLVVMDSAAPLGKSVNNYLVNFRRDIKNIAKSPVKFDIKRLRFLNREHLKMLNEQEFALLLNSKDSSIGALAKLYLQEASTLNEIRTKIDGIFTPKCITQQENNESFEQECIVLYTHLREMIESYSEDLKDYESLKKALLQKSNLKGKRFFKPLRILLTGSTHGLELSEIYPYLRFFLRDIVTLDSQDYSKLSLAE